MTSDKLRAAAQAVVDWQDDECNDDFREWEKRIEALRNVLYEVPCHVDTGATRAAKSVKLRTCSDCGKPLVGGHIHTCSPQIRDLSDEEIIRLWEQPGTGLVERIRAVIKASREK